MDKLHILLISDNEADVEKIKSHLEKNMRVPWDVSYCTNVNQAKHRFQKADVLILDLGLSGLPTPKELYQKVQHLASETPIIVLTGKDEHDLATYVMEQGAADKVIRGKFGRLVDAIEFALIRQKITTDKKQSTDETLFTSQSKGDTDLKESKEGRISDQEKSHQILRMFSGGYAVDQNRKTTK